MAFFYPHYMWSFFPHNCLVTNFTFIDTLIRECKVRQYLLDDFSLYNNKSHLRPHCVVILTSNISILSIHDWHEAGTIDLSEII